MESRNKVNVSMFPEENGAVAVLGCAGTFWVNRKRMAIIFESRLSKVQQLIRQLQELEHPDYKTMLYQDKKYYNLAMVMAIGFRLNSVKAQKFINWASQQVNQDLFSEFIGQEGRKSGQVIVNKINQIIDEFRRIKDWLRARVVDTGFSQRYNPGVHI